MNTTKSFQTSSSLRHAPFSQDSSTSITYEYSPLLEGFPLAHGVTYRYGGVSEGNFNSFNMGLHVGDDPKAVAENRKRLAQVLGVDPNHLTCGEQVHGVGVTRVTEELVGRGAFSWEDSIPDSDAIHTNLVNVPLLLLVADCVPGLIYAAVHHAVAVVHAGWRGAIGRLSVLTIEAMKESYGTEFKDCYIYLGPSIGPESFEVDVELGKRFELAWRDMTDRDASDVVNYPGDKLDKAYINLWNFIGEDLLVNGVPPENITIGGTDSVSEIDCYSYRREAGLTGRMALFAMLQDR